MLIYKKEVYAIVGAAMEVYNTLGAGFLEPVYQEAFGIELGLRGIPFSAQRELRITYKDRLLSKSYVADLIVFEKIIVEVKALTSLTSREEAQLLNYLKATGHQVGVLINFGSDRKLDWKRMVFTKLSAKDAIHE
ncbi:MAG TPA: GxxExxY protein [Blastocatellia bacterium]|jgi:GxxExxY protein|nr:GxxExxY protein [Blastocatellia bacterium]